jgi:hypothetical protein
MRAIHASSPHRRIHRLLILVGVLLLLLPLLLGSGDPVTADADADRRCVEALYELALLEGKYKVYKPAAGDARTYLDDADRPAEIARLQAVRDASCSASRIPSHAPRATSTSATSSRCAAGARTCPMPTRTSTCGWPTVSGSGTRSRWGHSEFSANWGHSEFRRPC